MRPLSSWVASPERTEWMMFLSRISNCSARGVELILELEKVTSSLGPDEALRDVGCGGSTNGDSPDIGPMAELTSDMFISIFGRSTTPDLPGGPVGVTVNVCCCADICRCS